jgi:hypothetical protein
LDFIEQLFDEFNSNEIKNMVNGISKLEKNINQMARLYNHDEKE